MIQQVLKIAYFCFHYNYWRIMSYKNVQLKGKVRHYVKTTIGIRRFFCRDVWYGRENL